MGEWKSLKTDSGTGWKEIYREAGSGWKALEWEGVVAIDVGAACIDRSGFFSIGYTTIEQSNPANTSGTITSVCLYMFTAETEAARVGTFYQISGNTYKCRDAEDIGTLSVGENNKNISLTVVTGDLIGCYLPDSNIDRVITGGGGIFYLIGNKCVIDNQSTYNNASTQTQSLYGTG